MFKKYVGFALIILTINLFLSAPVFAATTAEKEAQFAEKVKADIVKLGTGKDSLVEVKLKDGTKIKGYVNQIKESSFIVVDENGKANEIPYPNAKQVKGNNLSTGAKIAIGIGIGIGICVLIIFLGTKFAE